jgi:hypothetical protein
MELFINGEDAYSLQANRTTSDMVMGILPSEACASSVVFVNNFIEMLSTCLFFVKKMSVFNYVYDKRKGGNVSFRLIAL